MTSGLNTTFIGRDFYLLQVVTESDDRTSKVAHGANVRFTFDGCEPTSIVRGAGPLPGRVNYLTHPNESDWIVDVPTWSHARIEGVRHGASVVFHENGGQLEYDLELAPGTDASAVVMHCEGSTSLEIDPSGALVIGTAVGAIKQEAPRAWVSNSDGTRREVPTHFRVTDGERVTIEVPERQLGEPLLIDPTIVFSGRISGSSYETGRSIAVDALGNVFVAGKTSSTTFPLTPGAFDSTFNNTEGFVTKINPAGTAMVFSTYIGSTGADDVFGLRIDSQSRAVITGRCGTAFPVTSGAYDTSQNGWTDVFVTKLNPAGNGLVFSTYFGGNLDDIVGDIRLDATGNVIIAGSTASTTLPTTSGAFDTTPNGGWDAFVAKLSATGNSLLFSTRLGGAGQDSVTAIAINGQGQVIVTGATASTDFPTTPTSFDTTFNGTTDAFVTAFNPTCSTLVFSTFLGGIGADQALALDLDATTGAIYLTGQAYDGYPVTPGAFSTIPHVGAEAFLTSLSPQGDVLNFSTFLGGSGGDATYSIAVASSGEVFVAGYTNSPDFPATVGGILPGFVGGGVPGDGFVSKFTSAGGLVYSTFVGGNGSDQIRQIVLDPSGGVYVVGTTASTDLPTTAPPFSNQAGLDDAFFMKIDMGPGANVTPVGPGCTPGGPAPSAAGDRPYVGQAMLLSGAGAEPNAIGTIFVGVPGSSTLTPWNCSVYVNVAALAVPMTFSTDAQGSWSTLAVVPPMSSLVGAVGNMQAVVFAPANPWGYQLTEGLALQFGF